MRYIPVAAQRLVPLVQTVQQTIETPQLLVDKMVDAPVMQVVLGSCEFHRCWRCGCQS